MTEHHTEMFDVPDKTQPPAFWYHHRSDEADDYLVYDPRCEKCRRDHQSKKKKVMANDEKAVESLKEVGVNILHYLDNLDQTTFCMSGLREQLRYALADCGIEPERITNEKTSAR